MRSNRIAMIRLCRDLGAPILRVFTAWEGTTRRDGLGNYDEAIRYLEQALKLRDDAEISAHLGEVLWMAGDRTQARTVWRRALKHTPDNESLLSIIKKFGQ